MERPFQPTAELKSIRTARVASNYTITGEPKLPLSGVAPIPPKVTITTPPADTEHMSHAPMKKTPPPPPPPPPKTLFYEQKIVGLPLWMVVIIVLVGLVGILVMQKMGNHQSYQTTPQIKAENTDFDRQEINFQQ